MGRLWRTSIIVDRATLICPVGWHGVSMRRRRIIGVMCHGRTERLAVCTVYGRLALLWIYRPPTLSRRHGARVAEMRISGMGRYESLRLRGYRREDAFLLKTLAIRATSIIRSLKTRAANLNRISVYYKHIASAYQRTLRRRQYRHAMAVRCLGAG